MKIIKRFYGYLKKDFLLLYKRKKYLYLFLLLPIIIATLFLFALNPGSYSIQVGICDFDNTDVSKESFSNLDGFKTTLLEEENCLDNLKSEIQKGKLDLGLEIGDGFKTNLENLKQAKLVAYYDNTNPAFANLISWKLDESLEPFEREIINSLNEELTTRATNAREGIEILTDVSNLPSSIEKKVEKTDDELKKVEELETEFILNPIWTDKKALYDEKLKKDAGIVFVFPLLTLFIILMLASTSIIYDRKTKFITRVKSTTTPITYLTAKTLFFTILVFIQFLIILILFLIYGGTYEVNIFSILKLILFVGVIDTLIGFLIGMLTDNEGIAVLFSLIIAFPLMLTSGIFFPIQALPRITEFIGNLLPLNYQIQASKSVLLFGETLSNTWLWFALGLFIIVLYFIRRREWA